MKVGLNTDTTLSYPSTLYTVLCPQRVSLPWKKKPLYVLKEQCSHPRCDSPANINGRLAQYFLNLNLLGRVWQPTANYNGFLLRFKLKKVCQTTTSICSGLSHPTRSLRRSKSTLRPDFQVNTISVGFIKKPMSPQETGRRL
jgi:hypothetical protein